MMVRYLKRLKSSRLGRVQAFPMYGGLGMSAPSLHRESTDSLMSADWAHKLLLTAVNMQFGNALKVVSIITFPCLLMN